MWRRIPPCRANFAVLLPHNPFILPCAAKRLAAIGRRLTFALVDNDASHLRICRARQRRDRQPYQGHPPEVSAQNVISHRPCLLAGYEYTREGTLYHEA